METRTIRVLFLRSNPEDNWMNRLVSYIDPPYCHVEIDFDMTGRQTPRLNMSFLGDCEKPNPQKLVPPSVVSMASSIYSGEKLFLRERRFANPNYTVVTLTVDGKNFNRMLNYCQEKSSNEVEFDEVGMYTSVCSFTILDTCTKSDNRTFCSEHVTRVLQIGGITEVENMNPRKVSPSKLYKILSTSKKLCIGSVPYKINLMQNAVVMNTVLTVPQT